ncbi:glycoside hydrolase family 88 protein [Bacteroides sp. OttesenSCG-928-J23]|nr:glycoside hydrolase family 88 protein [Bacteroides sp. OttesenSCG-928-N06]MDL2247276.1 glycoside hydrolase family 88 protein [Bacteroides sp. OttesenSCG-928-J23]MDL2299382.1 glycoside hydrolase family 88 protein [Bacteroides sp. OttesenSCG-928-E20]MDL2305999.1 glycoside hydrolase family 88 protein [Bacteroides sp. OttesenSCG-928-D19]
MKALFQSTIIFSLLFLVSCAPKSNRADEVIEIIHRVNTHWQTTNPRHGNSFWHRAAYHTGNMEAYALTGKEEYLKYSQAWAEHNEWRGAKSDNKEEWKYSYGETDDYVLFGDYQICFQVYADLYNLAPADDKIARAREVMEYQMSTDRNDYWWWADGLYMVMPVMTRLHRITGNPQYLDKLYEYWQYANSLMYDHEEGIYYRDAKYVYPKHKTPNDKKDFWARGNGWVFAAFARVLSDLPETDPHRDTYIKYYKQMARTIAAAQMEEGYWSRSMLDSDYASGYETSGTAFFTYGFLWGINNGYFAKEEYGPTVEKAWNYLTQIALQDNGKVGYVQPIGENAGQHKVDAQTTADFGVGAFLLAACEMVRYCEKP